MDQCSAKLQSGVVWRLDRLGRSMKHLITLVEHLRQKNIGFISICGGAIGTTTASGELIFNILLSISQFERRLERTKAGLEAARSRGKKGGRRKIENNLKVLNGKKIHQDHGMSIDNICKTLKISRASFHRYIIL